MIRPATHDDVEGMVSLLHLCDLYNPTLDYRVWGHPTLVATEQEGQVIGLCQVLLGQPYAYMTEIAVHPSYRNKGIGKQLVNAMEDIMRGCGVKHWCAITLLSNPNAAKRMEHIGAHVMGIGTAYLKEVL